LEGSYSNISLSRIIIRSYKDYFIRDDITLQKISLNISQCIFHFFDLLSDSIILMESNVLTLIFESNLFYFHEKIKKTFDYFLNVTNQYSFLKFKNNTMNYFPFKFFFYFSNPVGSQIFLETFNIDSRFIGSLLYIGKIIESPNSTKDNSNRMQILKCNFGIRHNTQNFISLGTSCDIVIERSSIEISILYQKSFIFASNEEFSGQYCYLEMLRNEFFAPKNKNFVRF
jgi:hypothetical protein